MVRRLAMLGAVLWTVAASDGILPDFGNGLVTKKQPEESLEQTGAPSSAWLSLSIAPVPMDHAADSPADLSVASSRSISPVPKGAPMNAKSHFGPREAQIADHYRQMSAATEGQFYNAVDRPLMAVLDTLLREQLTDGADVVFLIDHTSSMEDDIAEIRAELQQLASRMRAQKGVRVGFVTFSDVKSGSKFGYRALGLRADWEGVDAFLDATELLGSIEDVYGAIYKTVEEFQWQSKSKRLIVIISDEQPAVGKDTQFTEEMVVAKCAQQGVKTNLYPVLVDKYLPAKQP
jgi:hypothetical protein